MLKWVGPLKTSSGVSTPKAVGFKRLLDSTRIKYKEYEKDLLDLNVYAINQAILAAYGCGNGQMPEPQPGYQIKWGNGFITQEDILYLIAKFDLPCKSEFISLPLIKA